MTLENCFDINLYMKGLALQALHDRKLRWQVRPKMRSLEHMNLCNLIFIFFWFSTLEFP